MTTSMKTSTLGLPVTAIATIVLGSLLASTQAQTTATTDPVGFVTQTLAGNADSYVYIPFKRNPDYAGATVGAVSGAGNNVITVAAGTGWTNSQFAINGTTFQPRYYLLVRSGAKAGMFYTIADNTATTLTLDLSGDSIVAPVVSGTTFQVCAYDTLGSVFPSGSGVNGSALHSIGARQSEVLIPDSVTAGTNLAPAAAYYYYTGAIAPGAGWRLAGNTATLRNDTVLYPDSYLIVRHNVATATSLTTMGTVHMGQIELPLTTIAANTNQDIPISVPVAGDQTLAQTMLLQSGAFVGSTLHSIGSRKDELLLWNNAFVGKNKAPDASYYYYSGAVAPGPGWRLAGDTATIRDNEVVLAQGKAIAIRKKTTGAASTSMWTFTPSYAQ